MLSQVAFLLLSGALAVSGFNNAATSNLAVYWGQNSYGATHSNTADWQQTISYYCQDDTIDAIPMAFLNVFFGTGGLPSLDLSNICSVSDDPVFNGTQLPNCSFLAAGIETCQSMGKIVTMSLGGATGAVGFTSVTQAETFALTIWNLLLGGTSTERPFGSAVLDGIDLDIEGGSTEYFSNFVTTLRGYMDGGSKTYYITGAPQCPFPDAYLGSVINAVAFDALYVQFYNNYCELTYYSDANDWDFGTWDNWAKTTSPNPNIKIYIGAPADSTAAGTGYVDVATLGMIAQQTLSEYSSFGGVMLWDASQAYANGRYDQGIKSYLTGSTVTTTATTTATSTTTTTTSTTTTSTTTTAPATTTTASTGSCGTVASWVNNVAYTSGNQVVYSGSLWTANQWNYAETPGGASGAWNDDGPCATTQASPIAVQEGVMTILAPVVVTVNAANTQTTAYVAQAKRTSAPEMKRSRLFKV